MRESELGEQNMGHRGSVLFCASCRGGSWQVWVSVWEDDLQLPVVGRNSKALCFSFSLPRFFFRPFSRSLNACSRLLPSSNQVVWGRCHRRSGMRGMRRLRESEGERGCVWGRVYRHQTQISAALSLLWKPVSASE